MIGSVAGMDTRTTSAMISRQKVVPDQTAKELA